MTKRASGSSGFAAIAGVLVIVFAVAAWWGEVRPSHWSHALLIAWAGLLGVGLVFWSVRDVAGVHWIGNPTLNMVAGVSGGAIAAIALASALNSGAAQNDLIQKQTSLLNDQLTELRALRLEVASLHNQSSIKPQTPVSPTK